jgi:transcriptional regulator with XRE-family HTH domain
MPGKRHLTSAQVLGARKRYADGGVSQADLARRFNVSHAAMGYLLRGESYKDVGGPVGTRGQPSAKWDVSEARRLRAKGWTYDELGERYGVSFVRVWPVLNRSGRDETC